MNNSDQSFAQGGITSKFEVFAGGASVRQYGSTFYNKSVFFPGYLAGFGINQSLSNRFALNIRFQWEKKGSKVEDTYPQSPDSFNNPPTSFLPAVPTNLRVTIKNLCYTFSAGPTYSAGKMKKLVIGVAGFYSIITTATENLHISQEGKVKVNSTVSNFNYQNKNDWGIACTISYPVFKTPNFLFRIRAMDNVGLSNLAKIPPNPAGSRIKSNSLSLSLVVSTR